MGRDNISESYRKLGRCPEYIKQAFMDSSGLSGRSDRHLDPCTFAHITVRRQGGARQKRRHTAVGCHVGRLGSAHAAAEAAAGPLTALRRGKGGWGGLSPTSRGGGGGPGPVTERRQSVLARFQCEGGTTMRQDPCASSSRDSRCRHVLA